MEEKKKPDNMAKSSVALREEAILDFWQKNKIFEKTLAKDSSKGEFVFYDGPPFGTGTPHYGHVLAGTIKDVFPRYKTMQGFHVRRQWGWDCHGLPVENLIEQELGLNTKKDIENYGIGKFNSAAKNSVLRFANVWERLVPRVGRFVDMENDYKTMDASYTESIWWAFKSLHEKGLIYEGYKPMHLCPRCETTLSNFEVGQGYKDITDISVYVKFELADEPNTFLIAWTTTPWTLPGNVALAVNPKIEYMKVSHEGGYYIVAKDRIVSVFKNGVETIVSHMSGAELVGKSYIPPFDYYFKNRESLENGENGWKIYGADFVTLDAGTGIVHIAPAFGEDDMNLGKAENLPFIQHVSTDGRFKPEVTHFAGSHVKPKDNHQAGDIEIIKYLAHNHHLFEKEKIIHSYPHCWRCSTPLLNYASSSWFVEVTKFKDKLVAENQKINWVPEHIKEGRFGNWLSGARDWAISRSRYWGAPLPVWRSEEAKEIFVMGGLSDMKPYIKTSGNKYFVMRHGEAENNVSKECVKDSAPCMLTENGQRQVLESIQAFNQKIDIVISSPFKRTQMTTDIVCQHLGFPLENVVYDDRIHEWEISSEFFVKDRSVMSQYYDHDFVQDPFKKFSDGESFAEVVKRAGDFIYEIESKYKGKNIFIVSHSGVSRALNFVAQGVSFSDMAIRKDLNNPPENAEIRELPFASFPHNENYELDFHRPYIDEFPLFLPSGEKLIRVPEVFDCWFESGSMPFAQFHYPFENKDLFEKNFPADFIAEGLDQTRGWFYLLIVLGVALFDKAPYKNVIVNGMILAEDGQKMSKSLKNYPDLDPTIDKYGSDAIRLYLLNSPVIRGEELRFSEKDLGEIGRRIIGRLDNVYAFYDLYRDDSISTTPPAGGLPTNTLDLWILARLNQLIGEVESGLEAYELDRAVRPFDDFVDDLSTWYLRRSRERLKDGDMDAKNTLHTVLKTLSIVLAPFTPFVAEDLYQNITGGKEKESVHLESWPEAGKRSDLKEAPRSVLGEVLELQIKEMEEVRKIVTLGLEARQKAGIKVRQPLSQLKINNEQLSIELLELIKDELNVKEIVSDDYLGKDEVKLDTEITPELKAEGQYRELVRAIQDLRKKNGLTPSDVISLSIETDSVGESLVKQFEADLKKTVLAKEINYAKNKGDEIKIEELSFKFETVTS